MRKRVWAMVLAVAMGAILILAGCGSSSTSPEETESYVSESVESTDIIEEESPTSTEDEVETATSVADTEEPEDVETSLPLPEELTSEAIDNLIDPFIIWVYIQEESFSSLTDIQKVEICAQIAFEDPQFIEAYRESAYYGIYPMNIDNVYMSNYLYTYFGNSNALVTGLKSSFIEVQDSATLFYYWGEAGDIVFTYYIDTIELIEGTQYKAVVHYTDYVEELDKAFEFGTMTYYFDYNYNSELGYYISDAEFEYTYVGADYISDLLYEATQAKIAWKEAMFVEIVNHYTELWQPAGTYSSGDFDYEETEDQYIFVLRYAMSDEEAEERIANGGIVSANVYVTTIWVDKETGEVTDEISDASWFVSLP